MPPTSQSSHTFLNPRQRSEAVAIARSWIGTPYILRARIKGAGVDCGTLLAEYLIEIGRTTREELEDLGFYAHDWFCHETNERYMLRLMRYAPLVLSAVCWGTQNAEPGTIILFRVGASKIFNHGGIVTKWPFIVTATDPVKETNAVTHWLTGHREMAIFDPWSPNAAR